MYTNCDLLERSGEECFATLSRRSLQPQIVTIEPVEKSSKVGPRTEIPRTGAKINDLIYISLRPVYQ